MIVFRLIAILAWLVASTLSASAAEHDASHQMSMRSGGHQGHDMASTSMTHDHATMMSHQTDTYAGDGDCDESCCDGLCLCGAAPAPAVIEPAIIEAAVAAPLNAKFAILEHGADPGPLSIESPPPRLV
ncbi:hypothetical protein [Parvularcula marina]|uniref:hypothetical protein n=1 Tax=Parvularcula marina TaxID=2292771 RepID=UPI0035134D5C